MKRLTGIVLLMVAGVIHAAAQAPTIANVSLNPSEVDRIVQRFSINELEFREALKNYVFSRSANINTLGMGGQITGTFRLDTTMMFTADGKRIERIVFAPMPTVPPTMVTKEDLEDLGGVNAFALEPSAISQYKFTLVGKEKIDELNLFVFDVEPKVMPEPKKNSPRYFIGRIWVDDADYMIVKTKGKGIPEYKDNKFPVVETWRENVDGKYWFPSYASSDDELVFDNGSTLKLKMRVKYNDYKLGRTDVRIIEEQDGEVVDKPTTPAPAPTPKKP